MKDITILYDASGSKLSYQNWSSVLKCFDIENFLEIGESNQLLEKFMLDNDIVFVALTPKDSIPESIKSIELKHFIHPNQPACYIFGNEKTGIPKDVIRNADFVVTIKTKRELLSHVAAAITLYDRITKLEKSN